MALEFRFVQFNEVVDFVKQEELRNGAVFAIRTTTKDFANDGKWLMDQS